MLLDKNIGLRREVFMKALAVSKVLEGRLEGKGKIAAAQAVASMLPGKTRKTWRSIHTWTKFYIAHGCTVTAVHGI